MKLLKTILFLCAFSTASHGATDSLLNPVIHARQVNQVRVSLASPCSPCALYWHAGGQGDTLIVNLYGSDTVKVQYDFQHFNSLVNSLRLYQGGKLRSVMPFTMDYPIPESIARRPKASAAQYSPRYLVNGRPAIGTGVKVFH
jgi:hypothetical protein